MLPITDEYVKFILEQNKHLMDTTNHLQSPSGNLPERRRVVRMDTRAVILK